MLKLSGKRPSTLGHQNGRLAPCPSSPNCVCSQATGSHGIAPLRYSGTAAEAMERLRGLISGTKRARIISSTEDYVHAEFESQFFGFVDDVEFVLSDEEKVIHVRSASRLGYSDLGANRRRIEEIRTRFS